MNNKRLKEKLGCGETVLGAFCWLESVPAMEIMGKLGLDFVIIDHEHFAGDEISTENLIRGCELYGLTPIVRSRGLERTAILKNLDMGAAGIMLPVVKTAAEVETFVSYAKYRPLGDRGCAPGRVTCYGNDELFAGDIQKYFQWANENTLTIVQCETAECVENIEEIVSVPGLDCIFVGPFDLSVSLGIPLQYDNPCFLEATEKVRATCKKAGKICLTLGMSAAEAREKLALGYDGVVASDAAFLAAGAKEYLRAKP